MFYKFLLPFFLSLNALAVEYNPVCQAGPDCKIKNETEVKRINDLNKKNYNSSILKCLPVKIPVYDDSINIGTKSGELEIVGWFADKCRVTVTSLREAVRMTCDYPKDSLPLHTKDSKARTAPENEQLASIHSNCSSQVIGDSEQAQRLKEGAKAWGDLLRDGVGNNLVLAFEELKKKCAFGISEACQEVSENKKIIEKECKTDTSPVKTQLCQKLLAP